MKWTKELDARLRELWPTVPILEVAQIMGMTREQVKSRAQKLYLRKPAKWTPEKVEYLKAHYATNENKGLAKALETSYNAVLQKASKLGLKKSEEYIKEINLINNAKTRFKKDVPPWNKGKRGLRLGGVAGYFKPGHVPHNIKYDGYIRINFSSRKKGSKPCLLIRIAVGKWIPYSHYVWKQWYGEIPEGRIICFKNGNWLDVRLENLEAITRRELRIRNSSWKGLKDGFVVSSMIGPHLKGEEREKLHEALLEQPELIEAKRNLLKLKRTLKKQTNE
jgi:hypothetical protein